MAEARVVVHVAVRVHEDLVHLRRQALEHVRHHRLAAEGLEALVDTAHAAALPACEHHAGDGGHAKSWKGAQAGRSSGKEFALGARSTGVTKSASGRCIS